MALELQHQKPVHRPLRDDKPKVSPKEELQNRIKGLEEARTYPGYSPQDVAAIDRVINQLKEKLKG